MTQEKKSGLREEMPQVAAWIDELREAFGRELVDAQIKAGLQGKGTFYATETGPDGQTRTVGSPEACRPAMVVRKGAWGYRA